MSDLFKKWVFVCSKCGWRKEIVYAWADLSPRKCPNKKCGCSFAKEPQALLSFDKDNPPSNIPKEEVKQEVAKKGKKK